MSEQAQPEWEAVNKDSMTYRMKVPGGWLYRLSTYQGVAGVFVPFVHPEEKLGAGDDSSSR